MARIEYTAGQNITVPLFDDPVADRDTHICLKEGVYWKAQVYHANGDLRTGEYGVNVTARDADGNLLLNEHGAYVYPREGLMTGTRLAHDASRIIRINEYRVMAKLTTAKAGAARGASLYGMERGRSAPPPTPSPSSSSSSSSYWRGRGSYGGSDYGYGGREYRGYSGRTYTPAKPKTSVMTGDVGAVVEREAKDIREQKNSSEESGNE